MREGIAAAIREKRLVEFEYRGHARVCEIHIFGQKDGRDQILAYQVDGSSSSGGLTGVATL